ncbi:MAG: S26 family signal peptidase [Myxococcales bacterium]|nr:S26 family signal peptidase [Myxococcales bacterium]
MSERLRVIAPVAVAMGGLYWLDGAARPLTGTLAFGCCAVAFYPQRATRKGLWRTTLAGIAVTLGAALAAVVGLRVVLTPSVPEGLYLSSARTTPRVGEYACFEPGGIDAPPALRMALAVGHLPRFWYRSQLMKRIGAVAGSTVSFVPREDGDHVEVDGQLLPNSLVHARDGLGRALPRPHLPHTLEEGEVWLTSQHSRGYDSRYFGPVRVAALRCSARPLWTL